MKTRSSHHKIFVPILVIGVLLLTAFTVQAASFKTAPVTARGETISALSVEKASHPSLNLSIRELERSSTNAEPKLMDDQGAQVKDLDPNAEDASEDLNEVENETEHEITGTVTAVMSNSWTINGVMVKIEPSTEIESGLGLGSVVKAEGETLADGSFLAREIKAFNQDLNEDEMKDGDNADDNNENEDVNSANNLSASVVEFTGQLTAIHGNTWTVDGMTVIISGSTEIKDDPQVGSLVKVEGVREPDSSIQARQVKLINSDNKSGDEHSGTQISPNSGQDDQNTSRLSSGSSSSSGGDDHGDGGQDGGGHGGGGDDGSGNH